MSAGNVMADEANNAKQSTNIEQVVKSLGDSWIVCRSKSHTGRVYYFNTLTGQACWNLSSSEIEKASCQTKNLTNQVHLTPHEPCEPQVSDSSMDQPNNTLGNAHQILPSSTSSAFSNQISGQAVPISPFAVPSYNGLIANGINSLLPLGVHTPLNIAAFNNSVWAVPPQQPLFLAPTFASLLTQGQTSVTVPLNNNEQFTNAQSSQQSRFHHNVPKDDTSTLNNTRNFQRNRSVSLRRPQGLKQSKNFENHSKKNLSSTDLRNYLSAKRKQHQGDTNVCEAVEDLSEYNSEESLNSELECMEIKNEDSIAVDDTKYMNDADSDWLEENILVQGRSLKLDLSNVKRLAKPDADPECWFVVTDEDILLHHLNLLNTFCNSDYLCQLFVPQQVMLHLRELAYSGADERESNLARRALAFIKQLLEANYVVVGEGANTTDNTRSGYLLDCCLTLSEQNYFVILLSNNEEIKIHENSSEIPSFTIKEIKQFLTQPHSARQRKNSIHADVIDIPIKITVANELLSSRSATDHEGVNDDILSHKIVHSALPTQNTKNKTDHEVVNDDILSHKIVHSALPTEDTKNKTDHQVVNDDILSHKIVHSALPIQNTKNKTDHEVVNDDILSHELVHSALPTENTKNKTDHDVVNDDILSHKLVHSAPPTQNTKNETKTVSSQSSGSSRDENVKKENNSKQMEFRLNRTNITIDTAQDITPEKKKYKWRKRRNNATSRNENAVKINTCNNNEEDQGKKVFASPQNCKKNVSPETSNITENVQVLHCVEPQPEDKTKDVSYDENAGDSESSSLAVMNNSNNKVFIDETSTSGIVSNSTSNLDSESDKRFFSSFIQSAKKFAIKDQNMEDYIRMGCDEWVSRFLQIIEEVLTQVLRQDQNFLVNTVYKLHGGGPWTILEATDCVKIRFKSYNEIIDAAEKFEHVYLKVSDHTGRIKMNFQPSEYMDMYSHGVCLVKMLQSAVSDSEDLNTAAQSLEKLLNDIQNPSLDASIHMETFGDSVCEDTLNNSHQVSDTHDKETDDSNVQNSPRKSAKNESPQQSNYNLRSSTTTTDTSKKVTKVVKKCVKTKKNKCQNKNNEHAKEESLFFSQLNLVKKRNETDSLHSLTCNLPPHNEPVNSIEKCNEENINQTSSQVVQPKVIRKFKICPEFEKRFQNIERQCLDLDALDYSVINDDDDFIEGDRKNTKKRNTEKADLDEIDNGVSLNEPPTLNNEIEDEINHNDSNDCTTNINNEISSIIGIVLIKVKEVLLQIHTFCVSTCDDLRTLTQPSNLNTQKYIQVRDKVRKVHVLIDNLCRALNGAYCREAYDPQRNIKSLLESAGYNDLDLNHQQLHEYRDHIGTCLQQAKILQECVLFIADAL